MKYFPIWLFASLVIFSQCKKNHDDNPHGLGALLCGTTTLPLDTNGYFAFGRAYGFCGGPNCATFFKIQNGKLYPDSISYYNGTLYFSSIPLTGNAYSHAYAALSMVPSELTNTTDTTIGAPDSHDQGGYYFEYKASATAPVKHWRIDTDTAVLPTGIENYVTRVGMVIDSL